MIKIISIIIAVGISFGIQMEPGINIEYLTTSDIENNIYTDSSACNNEIVILNEFPENLIADSENLNQSGSALCWPGGGGDCGHWGCPGGEDFCGGLCETKDGCTFCWICTRDGGPPYEQ